MGSAGAGGAGQDRERDEEDAFARAMLSVAVDPGHPLVGAVLRTRGAVQTWDLVRRGTIADEAGPGRRTRRPEAWAGRARAVDGARLMERAAEAGARLVVPGDPEWPGRLEGLGDERPYALWVRGRGDLRNACLRAVAVVGSRSASAYGLHVASGLAHDLARDSWSVVSGGAFGVDAAAHRGCLGGGAATVAVLACGPDRLYPGGNERLFAEVAEHGVIATEHGPGVGPTRHGFLVRNRVIAALVPGTVVVEAGLRSGALNTARHAQELSRTVMAVPGPVTSALSAGCHRLLRDWHAVCVTDAADVAEQLGAVGEELREGGGTVLAADGLDPATRTVLAAVPAKKGAGPAEIATAAGVGMDEAVRRLGLLAAGGFIERAASGWRVRPGARDG
ncbi:DNA-processing protein DprA [Nocardiopsis chromatogenes]|uniref:DNA-processing protein DprA n=1 Tax=Nocardiopsis chromatogenes TaxID=280239 RepID=UPI00068914B8|nr:DNA-processing protein DprA [Nocardiopsis chromatogenes]